MRYECMKAMEEEAKKMSVRKLRERIIIYREKVNGIHGSLHIAPPDFNIVNPGYSRTREAALENEIERKECWDKIFELEDEKSIFITMLEEKEKKCQKKN